MFERAQLMEEANGELSIGGADGGQSWHGAIVYLRVEQGLW